MALETDGIIGRKGAFTREWVAAVREDIDAAFEEARSREGGAVGRGPNRWYVEIHPEVLRGFVELVDHPWVRRSARRCSARTTRSSSSASTCRSRARSYQPWHRDFPMPDGDQGRAGSPPWPST